MLKRRYILLFFVLLSEFIFCNIIDKYQWEKILVSENEELIFISGESENHFWLQTLKGTLIEITNKTVSKFKIPKEINLIYTKYIQVNKNKFICIGTTSDYRGVIYSVENNKWTKYNTDIPLPIKYPLHFNSEYYVLGDFGQFYKLSDGKWEQIETPYSSHTIACIVHNNSIIISTKSDGVYRFQNNAFNKLKGDFSFISELKIIDSSLYGLTARNKLLLINHDSLAQQFNQNILFFFNNQQKKTYGFDSRLYSVNKTIRAIQFPQNFNIGTFHIFQDNKPILFSLDGSIYKSIPEQETFFINMASLYKVDDLPNSGYRITHIFDVNNDGIDDLLLINNTNRNTLSIFQGVEYSSFANITSISNLPINTEIIASTISDVNKDGLNDVVAAIKNGGNFSIQFYINKSDFRFELYNQYQLPEAVQTLGIRSISAFDYDGDGDEDIIVTSYYGAKDKPGFIFVYQNNYWGNFDKIDYKLKTITTHWNEKTIFADLNNDSKVDIFNATSWSNDNLLIGDGTFFTEETSKRLPKQTKTETLDALLSDFDNDSDLDIFTVGRNDFIRVYENNGQGYFKEITSTIFETSTISKEIRFTSNLNIGDFNNDSFIDLLVSVSLKDSNKTLIFLNKAGQVFTEASKPFGNTNTFINNSSIADIDGDGDVDIYGTTKNQNTLWINSYDKDNSIKIILSGITSSTNAFGSKIWLYRKNGLNNIDSLIGYKELGTEIISKNSSNSLTTHFGTANYNNCEMKIRFLLGKEMVFKNIQAGSTIIVKEDTSFFASLYQLPGDFYRFFEQTKNQIYLFVILLSHLILFFGLWIGLNKINWSPKLTLTFAILNISLFWISLYFASFSTILFTKFLIPLLLTLLVTFIPLLLFFWVIKTNKKNSVKNDENLLRLVMLFSHGEWALRNLNSILLLCENSPSNWTDNSDFNDKLMQRLKTFSEMTLQSLNEIIESERTSNYQSEGYDTIKDSIKEVNCLIKNIAEEHSLQKLIDNFTMIRNYTKEVRTNIYSRFSCNPVEVINNITENFKPRLEENNISLTKTKMFDDKIPVLIKNYQLGDILDNMFQNSITLLKNSKVKNISIKLYKESPKIIIKFSNSGPQIDFNKWNKIFEQGYSESRSTGLGLFLASETTKKYGGRVFVQSSDKDSTSFIIELNEGIIKSK